MNLIAKLKKHLTSFDKDGKVIKSPWLSKTLWINGLTFLGSLLLAGQAASSPAWVIALLAATNMGLRFLTKEPVK